MRAVTMVSITHFWPSARVDRPLRWLALAWALALPVAASAQNADLESLRVERTDEGLLLSARLNIRLPGAVEEALDKGIPIHFVADATVMRERWVLDGSACVGVAALHARRLHAAYPALALEHVQRTVDQRRVGGQPHPALRHVGGGDVVGRALLALEDRICGRHGFG